MVNKKKILLFCFLFCYVFAFFIYGISVSLLMSVPLWGYAVLNSSFRSAILCVVNTSYIKRILKMWTIMVILSIFFPVLYGTYDYSFFRIVGAQGLHLLAALPFFAWLRYVKISFDDVETYFVSIFILQTIIQLIVVNNSFLGEKILSFNHFEPEKVLGPGSNIRGKALSAATTYHLTMAYGIAFIIYLRRFLSKHVSVYNVVIGILLFVGIFFAGRTGFVACFIGVLGYLFYRKESFKSKVILLFKSSLLVLAFTILTLSIIEVIFPDFYDMLNNQILPYAFEFLYSMDKGGSMETQSTNMLFEMWSSEFDLMELVIGSGKYTNADSSFYMHVDPGIIRHMLFMGIGGYVFLILYQLCLFPIWSFKGEVKFYYFLILFFLFIMEFKCINLGVNKFAYSITLLLSYSYLYLHHKNI